MKVKKARRLRRLIVAGVVAVLMVAALTTSVFACGGYCGWYYPAPKACTPYKAPSYNCYDRHVCPCKPTIPTPPPDDEAGPNIL